MKPNILFIHVDQMHADMISALGHDQLSTPAMDRLVREGYTFTKAYCAMPQCCSSRACWYTGRMSKEHGVVVNGYPIDPAIPNRPCAWGTGKGVRPEGERGVLELYDLKNDVGEQEDLSGQHPEIRAKIKQILETSHDVPRRSP